MTDKDVERVAEAIKTWKFAKSPMLDGYRICGVVRDGDVTSFPWKVFKSIEEASAELDRLNARAAIAAYESTVTDAAKLGTVSLTSFDGHCVRIDFPNREDAERMYAVLTADPRHNEAQDGRVDMCSHGAIRGSYCGYCCTYSQGAGREADRT